MGGGGGGVNESISVFLHVCSQQGERWENCWEKQKSNSEPEGQKEREWTKKQRDRERQDVIHGNLFLKIKQTYTSSNPEAPQADQYPLC